MTNREYLEIEMPLRRVMEMADTIVWFDQWDRDAMGNPRPNEEPLQFKFMNALAHNKREVVPPTLSFRDSAKKNAPWNEFLQAQIDLDKELCMKDEKGKEVRVNGQLLFPNPLERSLAQQKLKEKYAEVNDQVESELNRMIPLKLYVVQERYVPRTGITPSILSALLDFIVPNPEGYVEPEEMVLKHETPEVPLPPAEKKTDAN